MLDLKFIRDNVELVSANSAHRLSRADIPALLEADRVHREAITALEELRAQRNKSSEQKPSADEIEAMKLLGDDINRRETELRDLEAEVQRLLAEVPNLTHPEVLVSENEDENPIIETVGDVPTLSFTPQDHVALAERLDLLDLERGTKVAGAKFYYLKNDLARLHLALTQYALEIARRFGYSFMITPDVVKREISAGIGYNPRGDSSQVYSLEGEDLVLIATAEITLGAYHAGEVLDRASLPRKYVGLSHCFRTEAGAASKFAKGIFRVHQFEKLELFIYCLPEQAEELHQELVEIEKEIYRGLAIPFRVIDHCTADLGAPSYRTFDLEAWLPGKPNKEGELGDYAEITSASNCTDYQARGLNIKYLDENGKKQFVYTLNGTAYVASRPLIALLENYQQADGSILIPKVLQPYMGGQTKIT